MLRYILIILQHKQVNWQQNTFKVDDTGSEMKQVCLKI